jgi:RimJ/RimL family protein N-acetyltransferase
VDPLTDPLGGNVTTDRLTLRGWRDDDEPRVLALSTDPEVMRHFPRHATAAEAYELVSRHRALLVAGRPGLFAVETREEQTFLGFVGLAEPRFEASFTPCVEIGWRLVRSAWGHGYATEAARAVLRHGFETLRLPEILSFTATVNLPSIAVMRRLGMHTDPGEDFDHPAVPAGHPVRRHVLYRLRAEEWRARGEQ